MICAVSDGERARIDCPFCTQPNNHIISDGVSTCSSCGKEYYLRFYRQTVQVRLFKLEEMEGGA